MKLSELIQKIEKTYPLFLAESWDNVGLMIGDRNQEIHKILVSLEATEAVIDEAIRENVDLIVTHHPFFFSKFDRVTSDSVKGARTIKMIQNNIALYSMHTNYDNAFHGMSDAFLKTLGYEADDYFLPVAAQDWYIEANNGQTPCLGRIVNFSSPMTLSELSRLIKEKLSMPQIRFTGDPNAMIKRMAVITGSACDMFADAASAGADVIVSGDMKYHPAQDAIDARMNVIDCGHYETEFMFKDSMKEFLESISDIKVIATTINFNPFHVL